MPDTKKAHFISWLKFRKYFTTHEIMQYGIDHFYLRADRSKRDFMKLGLIKKLTKQEKKDFGYQGKDALYKYINHEKQLDFSLK